MIKRITKWTEHRYEDSGQVIAYCEFIDHKGKKGTISGDPKNTHMQALYARWQRED